MLSKLLSILERILLFAGVVFFSLMITSLMIEAIKKNN